MRRPSLMGGAAVALVIANVCGLAGCKDSASPEPGSRVRNLRPGVALLASPPQGDATRFEIDLQWDAWDDDGRVDLFRYCVDPPESPGADSLWQITRSVSMKLTFTGEDYGGIASARRSGAAEPPAGEQYHVFVIKAVDDFGALSLPDYIAFNSATLCPKSRIVSPPCLCEWDYPQWGPQLVGVRVTFRWEGVDIDGATSDLPAGYLYKLVDVTGETEGRNIAAMVMADQGDWSEVGTGNNAVTRDLEPGQDYGFAVRAIDEAGATEPVLLLNRNLIWVSSWVRSESKSLP